jgi:aspartate 1-decarboxylase
MLRKFIKSKVRRGVVTGCDVDYEGSIAIDCQLMEAAGLAEYEAVQVWNVGNGVRLETYAITAPPGSGEIALNGAAARHASKGDRVIIASFAWMGEEDARVHAPQVVLVGEDNLTFQVKK